MLLATSLGILAILLLLRFLANRKTVSADGRLQLIASGEVNTGRQFEIDIAKVISIVWMILVHVDEECYKNIEFAPGLETWISVAIEFVGGPLAAPVFMIAMGIGMVYSKNQEPKVNAVRGLKLVGQGYLLNIVRGTIPCLVFLVLYQSKSLQYQGLEELLCLDILHFAGLTFLFFALTKHFHVSDLSIAFVALALLVAGSVAAPIYPDGELISVWIGYFTYQNYLTPFPFFVWLIYPVAGYLFGKVLLRVTDKTKFYTRLLAGGAVVCGAFTATLVACGYELSELFIDDNMYEQNTVKVFWVLGIAAVWCGLLYFISLGLGRVEAVKKLVTFMSKKINAIFITQWILIGWMTWGGFFGCAVYGVKFLFFFVAITILTVVLVYLDDRLKKWWKNRNAVPLQS